MNLTLRYGFRSVPILSSWAYKPESDVVPRSECGIICGKELILGSDLRDGVPEPWHLSLRRNRLETSMIFPCIRGLFLSVQPFRDQESPITIVEN